MITYIFSRQENYCQCQKGTAKSGNSVRVELIKEATVPKTA